MSLRKRLFDDGAWYYSVPVLTAGLFAWAPFAHAASRLKDPRPRRLAISYAVAAALLSVLVTITPTDLQGDPQGTLGAALSTLSVIVVMVVVTLAIIQARPLRDAVYDDVLGATADATDHRWDPAVLEALAARRKRDEARSLLAQDPSLARDLFIGRPDLPRRFDDGGLVDLNSAPVDVLTQVAGLSQSSAQQVAAIRHQIGSGFSSVSEALALVTLSPAEEDRLRERGVVLPV